MKDVEKTSVERQNSRKRIRRRRRWMNVYGLVVFLLVLTAGITISYTFLFNINEIRVAGQSDMYSAEEIVAASGINEGDNLLRLDCKKSAQRILDELLYVETAKVDRKFPSSLEITVTRCVPAFNINYDGGNLVVSKKGKILANNSYMTDGLPIIYGLDPADTAPGGVTKSANKHKNEAFGELIKSIVKMGDDKIMTVDMSDENAIIVRYKNDMIFKMGNWNDVEYKLSLAENIMNDENVKGKKGYLTMIGTNQCSFRPNDGPVSVPGSTETTTLVEGERNPEQEASFNEQNIKRRNEGQTTVPQAGTEQWTNNNDWAADQSQYTDYSDNQWTDNSDAQWQDSGSAYYDDSTQWSGGEYDGGETDYGDNTAVTEAQLLQ